MTRVLDLGESCLERRLERDSRIIGTKLKPGAQACLLINVNVG
jgi:hypothetical protein